MPSESSCVRSRRQYPHQVVEYMRTVPLSGTGVVGSDICSPCQWLLRESQAMLTQTNPADGPNHPGPMSPDAILTALDPEQREVALALTGPVVVLAGAGTGKTRAITHRIAYGVRIGAYKPTSVLAVTFTARAAGEMRTRLRELGVQGVQARTFHSAALRQLGYFWPRVVGGAPPRLQEYKAPIIAE